MVFFHSNVDLEHEIRMVCMDFANLLAAGGVKSNTSSRSVEYMLDASVPQQDVW